MSRFGARLWWPLRDQELARPGPRHEHATVRLLERDTGLPRGLLDRSLQMPPWPGVIVSRLYRACLTGMPQGVLPISVLGRSHGLLCLFFGPFGIRLDFLQPMGRKLPLASEHFST